MILRDISLYEISWPAHRQSILTERLPMSECLGDLVLVVEKLKVHAGNLIKVC